MTVGITGANQVMMGARVVPDGLGIVVGGAPREGIDRERRGTLTATEAGHGEVVRDGAVVDEPFYTTPHQAALAEDFTAVHACFFRCK